MGPTSRGLLGSNRKAPRQALRYMPGNPRMASQWLPNGFRIASVWHPFGTRLAPVWHPNGRDTRLDRTLNNYEVSRQQTACPIVVGAFCFGYPSVGRFCAPRLTLVSTGVGVLVLPRSTPVRGAPPRPETNPELNPSQVAEPWCSPAVRLLSRGCARGTCALQKSLSRQMWRQQQAPQGGARPLLSLRDQKGASAPLCSITPRGYRVRWVPGAVTPMDDEWSKAWLPRPPRQPSGRIRGRSVRKGRRVGTSDRGLAEAMHTTICAQRICLAGLPR
jgi:hypothetical protein